MKQTLFKHMLSIAERQHLVKITEYVQEDVRESGIQHGMVHVFCPHTTAGLMINEKSEPNVIRDMIYGLERAFPTQNRSYRNEDGHTHARIKSALCGADLNLIIHDGELIMGEWQELFFCEFSGPRERVFYVKIMEG